jgi:hypothetical protein
MVQVEELKVFCDFIDAEYKQILGSVEPGGSHFNLQ